MQIHLIIHLTAWNKWLPFSRGALRGTSTSVISTCWCCFTRFPSLPALNIFSPKLIFRDRLLKSSFRDRGDLGAVFADRGRAKREGLDILTLQEFTCSKKQFLRNPSQHRSWGAVRAAQLGLQRRAASPSSFKQQARGGHAAHISQTCGMQTPARGAQARLLCAEPSALGSRCSSRGMRGLLPRCGGERCPGLGHLCPRTSILLSQQANAPLFWGTAPL